MSVDLATSKNKNKSKSRRQLGRLFMTPLSLETCVKRLQALNGTSIPDRRYGDVTYTVQTWKEDDDTAAFRVYWGSSPTRVVTSARTSGYLHRQADDTTAVYLIATHPLLTLVQAGAGTFLIWMVLVVLTALLLPPEWGQSGLFILTLFMPVVLIVLFRYLRRTVIPHTLLWVTENTLQAAQPPSFNWLRILERESKS